LPETEDEEFYYEDLVGLKVLLDNSKKEFGVIKNVANHGADYIIEIKLPGGDKTEIFAFTKKAFPEINITQGYVTLIEPDVDIVQEEE
jgi:16S rRNA processing protein RimM